MYFTVFRVVSKFVILLIKFYQLFLSPIFYPCCRFYPSCSSYMIQSIEKYGCLKGIVLGIKRLLRCHPLNAGGYDPVP